MVATVVTLMLIAALGVTQLTAVSQAQAEVIPNEFERLQQCATKGAVCTFHFSGAPQPSSVVKYSEAKKNCSPISQPVTNFGSVTVTETNSVSVSLEATLWDASKVFGAGFAKAYGHEWIASKTFTTSETLTIPPYSWGWIEIKPSMVTSWGWWEIHLPSRWYGHYIWYVWGFWDQSLGNQDTSDAAAKSRPMTPAERANCPIV